MVRVMTTQAKVRKQRYALTPIDQLKPHPANARNGDLEAIESSIAENGFFGAVVVQDGTGLVVVGNHRLRAARNRGITKLPAIHLECSPIEAERMALADNRTHDVGGYDLAKLVAQLGRVADDKGGLAGTGYDADSFAALEAELAAVSSAALESLPPEEVPTPEPSADEAEESEDPADAPIAPPKVPVTQRGDMWVLGKHRVLCGDSFDARDRARLLRGSPADLFVTDPPYAIYGSSTGIGADIADDKMVRPFFERLFRIIVANVQMFGHIYVCCDWRSYPAIWDSAHRARVSVKNSLVWDKGGSGLGAMYANAYEMIVFLARLPPPAGLKSSTERGQRCVYGSNVIRENRVQGAEREHNAQKPVSLFSRLVNNSSDPGQHVVDLFLGSGTTLISCERLGRVCSGFEIEPQTVDVIVARWERETGKQATLIRAADLPDLGPVDDETEAPKHLRRGWVDQKRQDAETAMRADGLVPSSRPEAEPEAEEEADS